MSRRFALALLLLAVPAPASAGIAEELDGFHLSCGGAAGDPSQFFFKGGTLYVIDPDRAGKGVPVRLNGPGARRSDSELRVSYKLDGVAQSLTFRRTGARAYTSTLVYAGEGAPRGPNRCSVSKGVRQARSANFETVRERECGNDPADACIAALRRACGDEPSPACVRQVRPRLKAINRRAFGN